MGAWRKCMFTWTKCIESIKSLYTNKNVKIMKNKTNKQKETEIATVIFDLYSPELKGPNYIV